VISAKAFGDSSRVTVAHFHAIAIALFLFQGIVWIGLPLLLNGSILRDVAEGVADGPNWQLSYLRHPPLSSWLSGIASTLGPFRYATIYTFGWLLASGAFLLLGLFLARNDKPEAGLVALLAGFASPFATYIPLNLNHNITVIFFWSLSFGVAWRAFTRGGLGDWLSFGAAVGAGLWAKYALLHLILPLVILFWLVPEWRRQVAKPGPWLAILVCLAIIAPHLADVVSKGATTLQYAVKATPVPLGGRAIRLIVFVLNCAQAQIGMALIAMAFGGGAVLGKAWRQIRDWRAASRFEQFLGVAAFGPVAIVLFATVLGAEPQFLWQTPFSIGFAAFWGHAAANAGTAQHTRRLFQVFAAFACLFVITFTGMRELTPLVTRHPHNQDMNGPALAALAQHYWAERHAGPIPFMVSLNHPQGFQAAESIAFDLPYRVETLIEGDPTNSPWLDLTPLKRNGALVVMTAPPPAGTAILGVPIENIETFARPMLRSAYPPPILFGELRGQEQ